MANFHNNGPRVSCNICHKSFTTKTNLQAHRKTVHSSTTRPRFPCTFPGCDKTYLEKKAVAAHFRSEHNENGCNNKQPPTTIHATSSRQYSLQRNIRCKIAKSAPN